MTDPYARPADQPAEGEVTIPLVPDSGYAQPSQSPFGEETLVDPMAPSPWASGAQEFGYTPTPGHPAASVTEPSAASGYPPAGDYWHRPAAPTPPQSGAPGTGQPYVQPTYQPDPAQPSSTASHPQSGYGQPQAGYAESAPATVYQPYPRVGQPAAPQWPAAVSDPVPYNYGYNYGPGPAAVDHPNTIPALVLGIIGLVLFQPLAPLAWHLGAKGQREARLDPNRWRASGTLAAGKILGIIGTVFLGLGILFAMFIVFALVIAA